MPKIKVDTKALVTLYPWSKGESKIMYKIIAATYPSTGFIQKATLLETAQSLKETLNQSSLISNESERIAYNLHRLALAELTKENRRLLVQEVACSKGKSSLSSKELKPLAKLAPTECYLCDDKDPSNRAIASHIIAGSFLSASGFTSGVALSQASQPQPIKHTKTSLLTEPVFCKNCDCITVGTLENAFKTELMIPLNQENPPPINLPWYTGDHRLDGQKLFALGASLGLRAIYCKLFSQIEAMRSKDATIDMSRLFKTIDRIKAVIKDPSIISDTEDFFIAYHIRSTTEVLAKSPDGQLKDLTQLRQYLESFEYHVSPVEKTTNTIGFLTSVHFGKYTFLCTLNLDSCDWGTAFEGFSRLIPKQETQLSIDDNVPKLLLMQAASTPIIHVENFDPQNRQKALMAFKKLAQEATVNNQLPQDFTYDHSTLSIKLPPTDLLINKQNTDKDFGLSYLLFCETKSHQKYVIAHQFEPKGLSDNGHIAVLCLLTAEKSVQFGDKTYHFSSTITALLRDYFKD